MPVAMSFLPAGAGGAVPGEEATGSKNLVGCLSFKWSPYLGKASWLSLGFDFLTLRDLHAWFSYLGC